MNLFDLARAISRSLWAVALAAILLTYADTLRLTFTRRHARYLRHRTKSRVVLGVIELSLATAALALEITHRATARIPGLPALPWLPPLVGAAVSALGAALAVLAKRALGGFFTANLAIKEEHRLITSGPYALVRHPIYLGLILLLAGTALVASSLYLAGFTVAITVCFVVQLRAEESILAAHFGSEWAAYRARVPALVPQLRRPASR